MCTLLRTCVAPLTNQCSFFSQELRGGGAEPNALLSEKVQFPPCTVCVVWFNTNKHSVWLWPHSFTCGAECRVCSFNYGLDLDSQCHRCFCLYQITSDYTCKSLQIRRNKVFYIRVYSCLERRKENACGSRRFIPPTRVSCSKDTRDLTVSLLSIMDPHNTTQHCAAAAAGRWKQYSQVSVKR